jgi:hypothetical protein
LFNIKRPRPRVKGRKSGAIRRGETLNIEALPREDKFQTELLDSGSKLREHGKIGKLYRDAAVSAGDVVLMSEVNLGQWQLIKRP